MLASRDHNEIADYFDESSLEAGDRFFSAFNSKCQQLVVSPNSGKSYRAIHPDLRGLSLESYVIFYRILDDGIEILRVVSGRRDFPTLFEEPN
nr:type II toxin-antitoxin system RelE/ParE family toxin [Phormidesmis priestleyi]